MLILLSKEDGFMEDDVTSHLPIGDPPDEERELDEDEDEVPEEEEEDFADLEALLAEATAATADERRLKQARKRLVHISKHGHATKGEEQNALVAEIQELETKRVWLTVATVALFHTQECITCGSKHSFFVGWMTEQKHASDPNARRLVAGKPVEQLEERREDHAQGAVELCSNCVECVIAINKATGESE